MYLLIPSGCTLDVNILDCLLGFEDSKMNSLPTASSCFREDMNQQSDTEPESHQRTKSPFEVHKDFVKRNLALKISNMAKVALSQYGT